MSALQPGYEIDPPAVDLAGLVKTCQINSRWLSSQPLYSTPDKKSKCRRDKSIPDRSAVNSGTPPVRETEAESTGERRPSILHREDANSVVSQCQSFSPHQGEALAVGKDSGSRGAAGTGSVSEEIAGKSSDSGELPESFLAASPCQSLSLLCVAIRHHSMDAACFSLQHVAALRISYVPLRV
ncbi:hypothetical protein UY3_05816 [Chelonia mydas]|uniref:Uncharacterized protein n=1 Tax=Chelonia mydas TaxID=8469 RepID=M7BGG8_CHEMY|nr:hypothetical protein UY3_05816 [Chelonia mydas]